MIYTLTLNPAMDKTVVIENLTCGNVNRIQSVRTDVGGKGINVSKCLKSLGCDSTAVAFWGGATGHRGIDFLHENGIGSLAVQVGEDTRTNIPGVFAAGDIRTKTVRPVITAAADGAVAAHGAEEYLAETNQ